MIRHLLAAVALLASAIGLPRPAVAATPANATIDYGDPATWLCRPGREQACTSGLDALEIAADGTRTPRPFTPAAAPGVDCFYVYPTVSQEPSVYSDMAAGPEEIETVRAQVGRLASRCRLFAPVYRQITLAGLRHDLATGTHLDFGSPYRDVLAAWRWYLAHDNGGRGVVLIGHSQGTILLQRLLAEEIDGKPAQAQLVSAFLAGDPSFAVPPGAAVGGTLKAIPLCASSTQTGCVYVWGSYLADDASTERRFGRPPGDALLAACVSPAAPGGGRGLLKAYFPRPAIAPASDPPWVEAAGQLAVECTSDRLGAAARVTILPTRFADLLGLALHKAAAWPGWGLHTLDVNLAEGNMLDVIDAETRTWAARR